MLSSPMFAMGWGYYPLRWSVSMCFSQVFARVDITAPTGLYARLCHTFSMFLSFLMISRRQTISESAGPIFVICSLYESILGADERSGPLFSNISRDVTMATNFVSYRTCLLRAKVSHDPPDRFSQALYCMVGIELQMINLAFFFRYLEGRCQLTNFVAKLWPNFCRLMALSFWNGVGYRLANMRINSSLIALHRMKRWW